MTDASIEKSELRKLIRAKRNALPSEIRQQAAKNCINHIISSGILNNNLHIGFYLSNDNELDLKELITYCLKNSKKCYLPIVDGKNMLFASYCLDTQLAKNKFNIPEPVIKSKNQIISAKLLDIVFMPLVAFNKSGHRLGMGAGFYDRTFAFLNNSDNNINKPKLIGVAYDIQCIADLPKQEWDIDLYAIATESKFAKF